jgi:hypothetical protein
MEVDTLEAASTYSAPMKKYVTRVISFYRRKQREPKNREKPLDILPTNNYLLL